MDGRCATCKNWRHGEQATWLPETHGECAAIPVIGSFETPTFIATVMTDSYANLVTRPTFGCVEWVHKDSPE